MVKKTFYAVLYSISGCIAANAQSDSTDLDLFMTDVVLETEMDSMLYRPELFELLHLEFTISDTDAFAKVRIELKNESTGNLILRKTYTLAELRAAGLIDSWNVSFPFGNLLNTESYRVAIIIQDHSGELGSTIYKTINP